MVAKICEAEKLSPEEEEKLKHSRFSQVSSLYHKMTAPDKQIAYLRDDFSKVSLNEDKRNFLRVD